jgi:hypothetical protein
MYLETNSNVFFGKKEDPRCMRKIPSKNDRMCNKTCMAGYNINAVQEITSNSKPSKVW